MLSDVTSVTTCVHSFILRNQVLTRDCDSDAWGRDHESSIPLEVVKDDQGRIYVRAQVRHFCFWSCWKRKKLDFGLQMYYTQTIPWSQRKRHQSVIKNNTPGVDIHAYAMQLSQWNAALESVKAGAGAEGFEANFEITGDVNQDVSPAAMIPQMVTIPSGHSHWFEIPRVGAGMLSSRKAAVVIVTESSDERDGRRMRMEAMEHLRSSTMLTVTLRVENGKVIGSPCAAESGGILSQVNRVIQNQANAIPSGPPLSTITEVRSHSETGSAVSSASTAGGVVSGRSLGSLLVSALAMADFESNESSPNSTVTGAATNESAAARPADKEPSNSTGVACAMQDAPAAALARVESSASSCPPPAELEALPSPVE